MDERISDLRFSRWGEQRRAEWRAVGVRMCAVWHGGAYVDIGPDWQTAWHVWNTWDYAENRTHVLNWKTYVRAQLDREETDTLLETFAYMREYH